MNSSEPKLLYRRLGSLFSRFDPRKEPRHQLPLFLADVVQELGEELKLTGAALYDERRDGFERAHLVGGPGSPLAETIDPGSPFLKLVLRHRSYLYADPAAAEAPAACGALPAVATAAIAIGKAPNRHVFFFFLGPGWAWDKVDFTLNTIRVSLSSRLFDERVHGSMLQAAEIQKSLLVDEPPALPGYDIACRSIAAEEVGGDFYDFMPFDGEVMGLAIGDASGHGLAAALLVRDVVTGLRMGIEKHLKVGHAFQKLNRVIHRSRLSSRFVSLWYGELEPNGNLIYVNGGHQPALLFLAGQTIELSTGGTVIGPLPEARFKRGFAHVDRGSTLLLYTDGLLERRDRAGEMFGSARLEGLVRAHAKETAGELIEVLFDAVWRFGNQLPWEDDATAVVIRREARPKA